MTTAHRPTWAPAKGGTNDEQSGSRVFAPSTFFRAKDQVAHTKLKFRLVGLSLLADIRGRAAPKLGMMQAARAECC